MGLTLHAGRGSDIIHSDGVCGGGGGGGVRELRAFICFPNVSLSKEIWL